MNNQLLRFSRFGLRALAITASTLALIDLIKQQWIPATACSVAWALIAWVEQDFIKRFSDSAEL